MQVNKLLQECFATTRLLNCALLPRQVNKLLEDFVVLRGEAWRGATADAPDQGQQLLADALQKYQVGHWGGVANGGGVSYSRCRFHSISRTAVERTTLLQIALLPVASSAKLLPPSAPASFVHRTPRQQTSWQRFSGTWMKQR